MADTLPNGLTDARESFSFGGAGQIRRSISSMFLLRVLSQGLTFVALLFLAQRMGPELYGQYSFIFGYLVFFSLIVSFGINEIVVREMTGRPQDRAAILGSALWLKGAFSALAVLLAASGLFFIHFPAAERLWGIIASLTLLTSFAFHSYRTVLEIPFQVDFRMGAPSSIYLISRAIFLTLLLVWMRHGASLGAAISAQLLSEILGTALLIYLARRRGYPLRPNFDWGRFRHLLGQSWPIALSGAFVMIYTKTDILLLEALRGSKDVGYYAVSMRLVDALAIIPTVLIAAALPILSQAYRSDAKQYLGWVSTCFRVSLYIILPIAVITALFASEIIRLFYGGAYAPSSSALRILIWAEIFVYCGLVFDAALVSSRRQRLGAFLAAGMAAGNLLINLWGIPRFGIVGAAWATTISYALGLIAAPLIPRIRDVGLRFWQEIILPLIFALGLGFSAKALHLNLLLACLWEVTGFIFILAITGQLRSETWRRAVRTIRGNAP